MGIFLGNPPEPCCNPTSPLEIGDDEPRGTHSRNCGRCNCVPDIWKLTIDLRHPLKPGRATLSAVYYLTRNSYRINTQAVTGDPPIYVTVPGSCSWSANDEVVRIGSNVNFQIVYDSPHATAGLGEWQLLDWGGSGITSSLIPDYTMRLWDSDDSGSPGGVHAFGGVFFNCQGTNQFRLSTDPESDPLILHTIEPFYA